MKSKFIVLTLLIAAIAIPTAYVSADLFWVMDPTSEDTDGANGFTGLNGASGVATFYNETTQTQYAVVVSVIDETITLIDVSNPSSAQVIDIFGDCTKLSCDTQTSQRIAVASGTAGTAILDGGLDDPRNIALFLNQNNHGGSDAAYTQKHGGITCTDCSNEYIGIVTEFATDTVSMWNFSDPAVGIHFMNNYTTNSLGAKVNNVLLVDASLGNEQLSALDGPWGVDTFYNATNGSTYAVVTAFNDDAITIFNMDNAEDYIRVASNLTDQVGGSGQDRPNLVLDGASGIATFYLQETEDNSLIDIPYAIVTATNDDGFQILNLRDPEHNEGIGVKMGYADATTLVTTETPGMGGPRSAGLYANATDGNDGFSYLDGAIDVATWNTTLSDRYAIIVSQQDSGFTIIDLTGDWDEQKVFEKQLSNGTGANGNWWNITNPTAVEVFKASNEHYYAAIANNGTAGTISLIDVYQPSKPTPVTAIITDDYTFDGGEIPDYLGGVEGITPFYLNGDYYLAATSYDDDGFSIIKLTGAKPSDGGASKICGFNYDCEAPTVSKSGGSIAINNQDLDTSSHYNTVDTIETKVGQLVEVTANIYETGDIYKSNLYFDIQGDPNWNGANAAIKYTVTDGSVEIMDNNDIFGADVTSTKNGDITQVTFKIMFTGEMDTSHIAIQTIDDTTNYQLLYFKDALTVTGTPTQTSTNGTLDDEITQTSVATVPGWVKNTAGWWADGGISEGEFVRGIEFLIQEQIIDTDAQTSSSDGTGAAIPDWVKNTAGWWADGAISEGEFVNAIEHLVKTGTIIII